MTNIFTAVWVCLLDLTRKTGRVIQGCIEGDCVPRQVSLSSIKFGLVSFAYSVSSDETVWQAIPLMIKWYREGTFPVDKLITCFPVSLNPEIEAVHRSETKTGFPQAEKFQDALHEVRQGTAVKPVLYWS